MLNPKKKIGIILGCLSGILAVLIVSAGLFLQSHAFQSFLLKQINQGIPGQLSWEALSVSVFSGNLRIKDIELKGADKTMIARIPGLSVSLSWRNLIAGEIHFSSVLVDSPVLDLELSQQGELNLLSAVVPPSTKPAEKPEGSFVLPMNIRINTLVFNNATIDFKAADQDLAASVSGFDLSINDLDLSNRSANVTSKIQQGLIRQKDVSIVVSPFSARADVLGEQLSHISVQTNLNGINVDILGKVAALFTGPVLELTMKSRLDFETIKKTFKTESLPTGFAVIEISANGPVGNPDAALAITYGPGTFHGKAIDAVSLKSILKDRVLTLLPSKLESGLGNLFLDGTVNFKEAFPDGFTGEKQDLDQVLFQLNVRQDGTQLSAVLGKDLKGRLSSLVNLSGRGVVPERMKTDMSADIQVQQVAQQSGPPSSPLDIRVQASAGLEGYSAKIHSLSIHSEGMELTGEGSLDMPGFDISSSAVSGQLRLDARNLVWLEALTPVHAQGQVIMTADVTGTLSALSANVMVQGKEIHVQNIQIGDALAQLKFSNGVLKIEKAMVQNKNSQMDINGHILLLNPVTHEMATHPDINLSLAADAIFLEDFLEDMKGKVSLNGQIKGNPEQLSGNLTLSGNHLDIRGQVLEKVSAVATIRDQDIEINEMEILVAQGSRINAKGRVLLPEKTLDIRMTSQDFDLTRLSVIQKETVQSGLLSLDITARGRIDNPTLDGNVHVRQIQVFQEKSDPVDLAVELKNRQLRVKGTIGPKIEGEYHLDTKEFSAVLSMDALLLGPYFKLAGQPDVSGNITAVIRAQGRTDQLPDVRGSADISSLAISLKNQPFFQVSQTTASYGQGGLTLPGTRIDFKKGGSLNVTGQGFLDKELDFKASGSFPLEIIRPLVKEIETASGTIKVKASLKGSIKEPLVHADLTFDDLAMTMEDLEQDFNHISGYIRVTPQKMEIVRFTGQLDQGRFDLGGDIGFVKDTLKDIDLKLNSHELTLDFPDLMELTLNSRLALSGTREKSNLTGEIVLLEGRYYRNVKLDLVAAATRRTRKIAPLKEKTKNPFLESIALNVHVSRREPLLVENNLAYLLISPDLTIQGTAHRPLLSGRATVDSGTINFQKTEFEVKKGIIDFVNPYQIEPVIEIEGEMKIRTWTINLAVSGTPDNLDLKFSSDPSESQADIISLIAFGKTTREMGQAQGGGKTASGEIVSGLLAEALKKDLQAATGMDQFEINMTERGNSGSQGVHVTVGKELSRQMSVTYGMDTRDGETVQRVTTYYKIMENLMMSGFQDSGGKFGGELKYRLEFR